MQILNESAPGLPVFGLPVGQGVVVTGAMDQVQGFRLNGTVEQLLRHGRGNQSIL